MISLDEARFVPLSLLLKNLSKTKVKKLLKTFKCPQNSDVENFLHRNAIKFELSGLSRTYIWFLENPLKVVAYFTVALKAITLDEATLKAIEEAAGEQFKEILNDLLKGFPLGERNKQIPVYLIGQLGKAPEVEKLGGYLLKVALEKIQIASEAVGGKIVVLDVVKKGNFEKLIQHYRDLGFRELYEFNYQGAGLIRLYYKLP